MNGNKTYLYIVDPDRKGAAPSKPKDAKDNESQKAYYARKYMEIHATDTNAKAQSEIDEITRRMIDVEQQLFAAQMQTMRLHRCRKSWPCCRLNGRRREEILYFRR